jgi:hypothetical protein
MGGQGTVEKVWKCLTEENKDVRKGSWTNKEVSETSSPSSATAVPFSRAVSSPLPLSDSIRTIDPLSHLS